MGTLTLIDLDNVAESNVNRQIHALEGQFGRAKVDAMAERIQGINPECRIITWEEFVEIDNLERLIGNQYDYLVDCIDAFKTKAALIAHCRRNKIRILTVAAQASDRAAEDPSDRSLQDPA